MTLDAPNFFLIGAAKAGTTSLCASLAPHPGIAWASLKETGFFCDDDQYKRGFEYYLRTYFRGAAGRPARGEATPWYLGSPKVPGRIQHALPGTRPRFVVSFRDPLSRAYSHYWMMVRHGVERASFETAMAEDRARQQADRYGSFALCYRYGSRYAEHLERWFAVFPDRADYLFLLFDDLTADPGGVLHRLMDFLGLPHDASLSVRHENMASASRFGVIRRAHAVPPWLREGTGRLLSAKAKTRLWALVDQVDRKPYAAPALDPDVEHRLRASFAADIAAVESLVGRSLPTWAGGTPTT